MVFIFIYLQLITDKEWRHESCVVSLRRCGVSFLKDGIRLHKSNFASIDQQLQPLLANGDSYRLIIKLYYCISYDSCSL